jgi:hypothetical protein
MSHMHVHVHSAIAARRPVPELGIRQVANTACKWWRSPT